MSEDKKGRFKVTIEVEVNEELMDVSARAEGRNVQDAVEDARNHETTGRRKITVKLQQ
jgi:peptidyl-tRNA hydrolase